MQIVAGRGYRGRVWLAKGPRPRPAKRGSKEIGMWLWLTGATLATGIRDDS
jgi:hypothetical protein